MYLSIYLFIYLRVFDQPRCHGTTKIVTGLGQYDSMTVSFDWSCVIACLSYTIQVPRQAVIHTLYPSGTYIQARVGCW